MKYKLCNKDLVLLHTFWWIGVSLRVNILRKTTSVFFYYIKKPEKKQNTNFIRMSELIKSQEEFLNNFNWHNFEEGIDFRWNSFFWCSFSGGTFK